MCTHTRVQCTAGEPDAAETEKEGEKESAVCLPPLSHTRARNAQEEDPKPPKQKITDPDELAEYRTRKRKEFEVSTHTDARAHTRTHTHTYA